MKVIYRLTGGRPMRLLFSGYFTSVVSAKRVNLYEDRLGRRWMATGKWALFRVASLVTEDNLDWLRRNQKDDV